MAGHHIPQRPKFMKKEIESYEDYVKRCKAMINEMKPYINARVDQVPTRLAMVLICNRWMNCWQAVNELEKLIFRYKPKRKAKKIKEYM